MPLTRHADPKVDQLDPEQAIQRNRAYAALEGHLDADQGPFGPLGLRRVLAGQPAPLRRGKRFLRLPHEDLVDEVHDRPQIDRDLPRPRGGIGVVEAHHHATVDYELPAGRDDTHQRGTGENTSCHAHVSREDCGNPSPQEDVPFCALQCALQGVFETRSCHSPDPFVMRGNLDTQKPSV